MMGSSLFLVSTLAFVGFVLLPFPAHARTLSESFDIRVGIAKELAKYYEKHATPATTSPSLTSPRTNEQKGSFVRRLSSPPPPPSSSPRTKELTTKYERKRLNSPPPPKPNSPIGQLEIMPDHPPATSEETACLISFISTITQMPSYQAPPESILTLLKQVMHEILPTNPHLASS